MKKQDKNIEKAMKSIALGAKFKLAEEIGVKARALKRCDKILKIVDKEGATNLKLGNTGIELPCVKGDVVYSLITNIRARLAYEIESVDYNSTKNS